MPQGNCFSGSQDQISEISDPQLDNETNPPRRKNQPISLKEKYGVDLQKVGKMTKTWVKRHYVLHNHAMYIFDKKSDHNPRRKY